jgi:hypothetical protein
MLLAGWLLVVGVQAFAWGMWSDAKRFAGPRLKGVDKVALTCAILCWLLSVALGVMMGGITYQLLGGNLDLSWVLERLSGLPEPTRLQ